MIVLANECGHIGVAEAVAALESGRQALDAVELGIRPVEADGGIEHVGRGGAPNLLGEVECDAAIMNGASLNVGSVGALTGFLHAISVARKVMDDLPHVMLVGEGAARFAGEIGAEQSPMLTDKAQAAYQAWIKANIPDQVRKDLHQHPLAEYSWPTKDEDQSKGTTIFLAIDQHSNMAGGTSTSGWSYKYPGRLGDSPVIGAGLYVDNRYGACACTHTGEMTIRANTAGSVIRYMKGGASVAEACHEAVDDLRRLTDGYLGPVVIHAIDAEGKPFVISTLSESRTPKYWIWTSKTGRIESQTPQLVQL